MMRGHCCRHWSTPLADLPRGNTIKGHKLCWRHEPLLTDDPLRLWQGVLRARKLSEADPFFSPRLADLPDPMEMRDMPRAAERLAGAILAGEPIHVFGDFDADGVCGTAILVQALRGVGAKVGFSIPHRVEEGHGIGEPSVQEVLDRGVTVGISVDTGTNCFAACRLARKGGMDLVVTDHHLPDEELPEAFAVLNPSRADCGFADRQLCGTGVAFFLLMGVWRQLRQAGTEPEFDLRQLLDRVAVATVADVMDLVGVNRILVHHGLEQLNSSPSIGMAALLQVARVKKKVSVETIGFQIAPRINAAGRMQHGEEAMRLLVSDDPEEAGRLAAALDENNALRRRVESEVFRQAAAMIEGDALEPVLAVCDASWHAGVVGLAAGRLARRHGRPAAVGFVSPSGDVRISLRGVPGFHVGDLLNACAEHLHSFGGHAGAGGGVVKRECWEDFRAAFARAVAEQAENADDHRLLPVDAVTGINAMHPGLAERLLRFEPTGRGNPPCTWVLADVHIIERRELRGGVLRLKIADGQRRRLNAVAFSDQAMWEALQAGDNVSLIGQLQKDDWRGGQAVQFIVKDGIKLS